MKNKKLIYKLIFILVPLIAIFSYFFLNRRIKVVKIIKILEQNKHLSDIKVDNFILQKFFYKKNDKWILTAQQGSIFKNQNIVKCNNAKFKFILGNKIKATIKAPILVFKLKENKVILDGGIKSILLNNPTSNNSIN